MSQSDFVTRGQTLVASGQFQEAVKVCRLGLLGRPTTVEGRIVLGQALLALKRYDEVLAEMRVALELDHTSLSAQVLKADALLRKGDHHAAGEVLAKLRPQAASDPRIQQLIAEVERGGARPSMTASHPAVGFLGPNAGESLTKHYPNHGADDEITGNDDGEDTGGEFTRPTSLAAPTAKKRSGGVQAMSPDRTPPPAILAVGDRSGTVEVDPEADGIELGDEDDFGEVAAPPSASKQRAQVSAPPDDARGSVRRATKSPKPQPAVQRGKPKYDVSSVELDSNDMLELDENTPPPKGAAQRRGPGPGTAVRNAVKMPSGPLEPPPQALPPAPLPASYPASYPAPYPAPTPASVRPTAIAQAVQPPLAQQIAQQPHYMQMQPLPQPPPPQRGLNAASMPTAAAMPVPQLPPSSASAANAARPTMALNAAQQQSAAAVDALFGAEPQQPAWGKATMLPGGPGRATAAANEPTSKPGELDPRIAHASPVPGSGGSIPVNMFPESASTASGKPLKTGVRKGRSRLAVAMWILIGAIVIGGGVFAGFQIRAMRLKKQIAAARDQAVDLAKTDTWLGWSGARDRLAGIAQASNTVDNRSALARARAVLAFEFGDGLAEAKSAIEKLAGQTNLDVTLARAYLALAQTDPVAAKAAADKTLELAPTDAAALYVAGQAALIGGDYKAATTNLKAAQEREPRPLYAVGLAHAIGATGGWDEALAAVDRALGQMPDHPGALIERAFLSVAGGRITPGNVVTAEIRASLVKLTAEGAKALAEQPRGVSPVQVALANLALAQIDFVLHDANSATNDVTAALAVRADEQRFGEELTDTMLMFGDLQRAKAVSAAALANWPGSRRARISQALVFVALGNPKEALDILTRNPEAASLPRGLAARGTAKLALGDLDGAKADFDAAIKKLPKLELALIGRTWIDLAADELDDARKRIEPVFNPNTASIALTTVYAAILRASGDPAQRDRARDLLVKVTTNGAVTPEVARAQLELARVARDTGDLRTAHGAYAEAIRGGNTDARLENALLLIQDKEPSGGRDMIEALLKDAGPTPSANLLLEGARARMLAGDNAGAIQLLDQADKVPNVVRWQYDRERGRLALRRNDIAGAAQALIRALDSCGTDAETFLLAADTVSLDAKQTALLTKLKGLYPKRLEGTPEALVITGKLALVTENEAEAEKAYLAAVKAFEKTTPRRAAQAHFGLAALFFLKNDFPNAKAQLEVVIPSDPTLYTAFLFSAAVEVELGGGPAVTKGFALANKAVQANPDYVDGWVQVGTYASRLGKKKELEEAITRVGALAPSSDALKELQALKK